MILRRTVLALGSFVLCGFVSAETITLRNGDTVSGQIISRDAASITVNTRDGPVVMQNTRISEISVDDPVNTRPVDMTNVDPADLLIALAKVKSGHKSRHECARKCGAETEGDLDWDVACTDYCNCLWQTDNTKETCEGEFKDTTGVDPPFLQAADPVCTACIPKVRSVKTCTDKDALGQNEDLVLTVNCLQSVNFPCSDCFDVIPFTQTCCEGGTCETRYCTVDFTPNGPRRP